MAQQPCMTVVSPQQFNQFYDQVAHTKGDNYKLNLMRPWTSTHCITCGQMVQLAQLLNNDFNRLEYIKVMYGRTVDLQNKYMLLDAFKQFSTAFMLYDYFNQNNPPMPSPPPYEPAPPPLPPSPPSPPPVICMVSAEDMDGISQAVKKEASESVKITIAKQAISAKKCFRVVQIKEIIGLMTFESNKLELAKFCYDFCIDKENYYQVADALTFSNSKEELMKYINSKK